MNRNMIRFFKCILPMLLIFALGAHTLFAGEEGDGSEYDKPDVTIDTCGNLGGNLLTYTVSSTHSVYSKGFESIDEDRSIDIRVITKDSESPETTSVNLLNWQCSTYGLGPEPPTPVLVKPQKNILKLFYDTLLLAHFINKNDKLDLAPEFRTRIIKGIDKRDSTLFDFDLYDLLKGSSWEDEHIVQVLRLHMIKDSLRWGHVDAMIESLKALSSEAVDDTISRICKRLSDSLIARKKADQPAALADAKKIGIILSPPVYPPLDSPTVFWQDKLLCVVQESKTPPLMLRTFDPAAGKWGKKMPVRFPETGMSQLFVKNTGTYSVACPYDIFCWHKKLGKFNDDPCDGLDCSPLLILNDPNHRSVENHDDLVKAGGSCAAGNGTLEFREGGNLYHLGDTNQTWSIFPGNLRYGSRSYPFDLKRDYPVVVSPDQQWVAYALDSKDGKNLELWVARLKYKK
jgi:hypothetical protein